MSPPTDPRLSHTSANRTPQLPRPRDISALGASCLIAAAALIVYWPSLHGRFFLDDGRYLTNNPLIGSPDGLYRFWFTKDALDYYPVSNTTLWIEWRLWGADPFGYRITNLIVHIATSLLVWLTLRRLLIPGAYLAGLLFAIHPVNVEAVAWISQRKDMLAMFFAALAILWYVCLDDERGKSVVEGDHPLTPDRWYFLSLAAFALAMLSKGSVASAPLAMLLIVWWRHGHVTRRQVLELLPFLGIAVLMGAVNAWYQLHGDPVPHAPALTRLAGAGAVEWFYLSKAIWPFPLLFCYPQWHIAAGDLQWWLPLGAVIVLTAALIYRQRNPNAIYSRTLLFAWGFFSLALFPVMGFAEVGGMKMSLVADHYQHFAIIAVIALVAAAWSYWQERTTAAARSTITALGVALVGVLAVLTWRQCWLFGSPIELYQATLAANNDPYAGTFLHNNVAVELTAAGRFEEAVEHYQKAITLMPENAIARIHLGEIYLQTGRNEAAIEQFQSALQVMPNMATAQNNLAIALRRSGRVQEAIDHYQKALKLKPAFPEAHFNLANALAEEHRIDDAIAEYEAGLQFDPDNAQAHYFFGRALEAAGRSKQAVEQYLEALRLQPDYADVQASLAKLTSGAMPTETTSPPAGTSK